MLFTRTLGLIAILSTFLGCSSNTKEADNPPSPLETRDGFCDRWGVVACNAGVVTACGAATAEACVASQSAACRSLVDDDSYVVTNAAACLAGVEASYTDAKLTGDELSTVVGLGDPCGQLYQGATVEGGVCTRASNCDSTAGFSCVFKPGASEGECHIPVEVGGGRSCAGPAMVCKTGFSCRPGGSDGEFFCIAGSTTTCANDLECDPGSFCGQAKTCVTQVTVGASCTAHAECSTGACALPSGGQSGVCVAELVLSPSDSLCEDLR